MFCCYLFWPGGSLCCNTHNTIIWSILFRERRDFPHMFYFKNFKKHTRIHNKKVYSIFGLKRVFNGKNKCSNYYAFCMGWERPFLHNHFCTFIKSTLEEMKLLPKWGQQGNQQRNSSGNLAGAFWVTLLPYHRCPLSIKWLHDVAEFISYLCIVLLPFF